MAEGNLAVHHDQETGEWHVPAAMAVCLEQLVLALGYRSEVRQFYKVRGRWTSQVELADIVSEYRTEVELVPLDPDRRRRAASVVAEALRDHRMQQYAVGIRAAANYDARRHEPEIDKQRKVQLEHYPKGFLRDAAAAVDALIKEGML